MRILHRYIAHNLLVTFLTSLIVLSFVMMVGLLFKATKYIASGASFMSVLHFIGMGFPGTLSMSIPISALVSTMLVFGRLSADSEISAMRACGVSMRRIMLTPFLLGAALSGICLHISNTVSPDSSYARRTFRRIVKASDVMAVIQPGKAIVGVPGLKPNTSIFVGSRTNEWLYNVRIREPLKNAVGTRTIKAESAHVIETTNATVVLEMFKIVASPLLEDQPGAVGQAETLSYVLADDLSDKSEPPARRIKDQHTSELARRRQDIVEHIAGLESRIAETEPELAPVEFALAEAEARLARLRSESPDPDAAQPAELPPLLVSADDASATNALAEAEAAVEQRRRDVARVSERLAADRTELASERIELSRIQTETTNRIVLALASLCFIAVAVPYGLKGQRRESSVGTAVCLGVCAMYYLFLVMTESLAKHPEYHPDAIAWCPVVLCAVLSFRGIQRNT